MMSDTDWFTEALVGGDPLFRFALADTHLKRPVIANPTPEHRRTIRGIFSQQLANKAIVHQYDSLNDFARALHAALK